MINAAICASASSRCTSSPLTEKADPVGDAKVRRERSHGGHAGTFADQVELPGVRSEPAQGPDQGGVVLLRLEPRHHHDPGRGPARIGTEILRHIRHPVVHGDDPVGTGDARFERQPAVELRHRDESARERTDDALQPAVDRGPRPRNAGGESPAVHREDHRDAEGASGQTPQNAGLGGMGRDEVRSYLPERRTDFAQRSHVAPGTDRCRQVAEDEHGNAGVSKPVDQGSLSAGDHGGVVPVFPGRECQITHVNLGSSDRIGPGDEIGDLHRLPDPVRRGVGVPEMACEIGAILHRIRIAAGTCRGGVNGVPIVRIVDGILLQFSDCRIRKTLLYSDVH